MRRLVNKALLEYDGLDSAEYGRALMAIRQSCVANTLAVSQDTVAHRCSKSFIYTNIVCLYPHIERSRYYSVNNSLQIYTSSDPAMAGWHFHRNPVIFTEGETKAVAINVATMAGRPIRGRSHITVEFHVESSLGEDHLSFSGFTDQKEKGMMKCEGSRIPNAWIELKDKAVWGIPYSCSFESPNITILSP